MDNFKHLNKIFIPWIVIGFLFISIPIGVYLSQKTTIFKPRAAELASFNPEGKNIEQLTTQLEQSGRIGGIGILSVDDDISRDKLVKIAKKRKELLQKELFTPDEFLKHATLAIKRDQFPEEVKVQLESSYQGDGIITGQISENFDAGIAKEDFYLKTSGQTYNIVKNDLAESAIGQVYVEGVALDDDIVLTKNEKKGQNDVGALSAIKEYKVLVQLVNFTDNSSQPFTVSQIRDVVFTGTNSMAKFYEHFSNGRVRITGDVRDWITIDGKSQPGIYNPCEKGLNPLDNELWDDVGEWQALADFAVARQGINISQYTNIIYVFPGMDNCLFAAYATFGEVPARINITDNALILALYIHEFGHNLLLGHANFLDCFDKKIDNYANCVSIEYKDWFSNMGSFPGYRNLPGVMVGFNGPNFIGLRWLDSDKIQEVTKENQGTFTIAALESSNQDLKKVLRIRKNDSGDYYYIDFRKHDNTLFSSQYPDFSKGVEIRIWDGNTLTKFQAIGVNQPGWEQHSLETRFNNLTLADNGSFNDPINDITIKQLSHSTEQATVEIKLGNNGVAATPDFNRLCPYTNNNKNPATCTYLNPPINIFNTSDVRANPVTNLKSQFIRNMQGWYVQTTNRSYEELSQRTNYMIDRSVSAGINPALTLDYFIQQSDGELFCKNNSVTDFNQRVDCFLGMGAFSNSADSVAINCAKSKDSNSLECKALKALRSQRDQTHPVAYPIATFDDFVEAFSPIDADENACVGRYNSLIGWMSSLGSCGISSYRRPPANTQNNPTQSPTPGPTQQGIYGLEFVCDPVKKVSETTSTKFTGEADLKWSSSRDVIRYKLRVHDKRTDWGNAVCSGTNYCNDNLSDKNQMFRYKPGIKYDFWVDGYQGSTNSWITSEHKQFICPTPNYPPSGTVLPRLDFPPQGGSGRCGYFPLPIRKISNGECFYSRNTCYDSGYEYDLGCDSEDFYDDTGKLWMTIGGKKLNSSGLITITLSSNEELVPVTSNGQLIGGIKFNYKPTVAPNLPVSPNSLQASCTNGVLNISWSGGGPKYELRAGMNLTKEQILDGTTWENSHPTSDDIVGRDLTSTSASYNVGVNNQFYTIWIQSKNQYEVSDRVFYPDPVKCSGAAVTNTTPSSLQASCTNGAATLSWSGNSPKYALRVDNTADGWNGTCSSGSSDFCNNEVTGSNYSFNALTANYDFWLHGIDSQGNYTSPSSHYQFSCQGEQRGFTAPTNLSASCSTDKQSATLSWNAVFGAVSYLLRADGEASYPKKDCEPHSICLNNYPSNQITINTTPSSNINFWVHGVGVNGNASGASEHFTFVCN